VTSITCTQKSLSKKHKINLLRKQFPLPAIPLLSESTPISNEILESPLPLDHPSKQYEKSSKGTRHQSHPLTLRKILTLLLDIVGVGSLRGVAVPSWGFGEIWIVKLGSHTASEVL